MSKFYIRRETPTGHLIEHEISDTKRYTRRRKRDSDLEIQVSLFGEPVLTVQMRVADGMTCQDAYEEWSVYRYQNRAKIADLFAAAERMRHFLENWESRKEASMPNRFKT